MTDRSAGRITTHPPGPVDAENSAPWLRLSPRMLLIHPIRELGRLLPALIPLVFIGSGSETGRWWTYAGAAVVILLGLSRWFTTRFRVGDLQVQLRAGLLVRRTKTTPLDRVRTIDVSASPLHRVLGLAKVTIGTGVSSRNPDWLILDGLPSAVANRLRTDLLHRRQTVSEESHRADAWRTPVENLPADDGPSGAPAYPQGRQVEQELLALEPKWIRYAPFTMSGVLTAVAVLGFGWQLIENSTFDRQRESVLHNIYAYFATSAGWSVVIQLVLSTVVAISVLSIGGYILAFWRFALTRHAGGTLHVSRGLLTTRAISIEERRLRGVEISQPLLLRAVGGARLLAITTGLREGSATQGGNLLAPPSPYAVVTGVAGRVLADRAATEGDLVPHGAAARRRRFLRAVIPLVVLVGALLGLQLLVAVPLWIFLVVGILLLLSPVLAHDRYRALGHARTGRFLVSRSGSLARKRSVIDCAGIIGWNVSTSYFQRRSGLVTLTGTTAAGRQRYSITDVDSAEALRLAAGAVPGLIEQFLVPHAPASGGRTSLVSGNSSAV